MQCTHDPLTSITVEEEAVEEADVGVEGNDSMKLIIHKFLI